MMKEPMLNKIFYAINAEDEADNPFETFQTNAPFDAFNKKYINPLEKSNLEQCNNMFFDLGDVVNAERERAFKVGYSTAIKLIFSALAEL